MERLALFKERPRAPVEVEPARAYDAACKRCALAGDSARVCKPAGRPGGLLAVGEGASKHEDESGSPFQDAGGTLLKQLLKKHWQGPVALDLATRCYPAGKEVDEKHVAACRGHLAHTIQTIQPERIVALGPRAIAALTGRAIQPLTVRRGYAWLEVNGRPVPIFYLVSEREAHRNRFIARYLEADLAWALSCALPPPRWGAEVNLVTTPAEAAEAITSMTATAEGFAFDLEWAGFQFSTENRPLVFSASAVCGDGKVWAWDEAALANRGTYEPLKRVLEDPEQPKGGANVKADCHTLLSLEVRVQGVTFDTQLMRKVLDTDGSGYLRDLQELVGMGAGKERMDALVDEACVNIRKEATAAQKRAASKQTSLGFETPSRMVQAARKMGFEFDRYLEEPKSIAYAFVPRDELLAYNATDTLSTARGAANLMLRLSRSPEQQRIWYKVVQPAMRAIARVEQWGVPLDVGATRAFGDYLAMRVNEATVAIRAYGDFDVESPDQLGDVLYGKLGLKVSHHTPTGKPSTDEEALEQLKKQGHPLPAHILTFRHYKKLQGYTKDWLYRVRPDGRVHPSINLDGARSGRTSSSDPNMQNVPSEKRDPVDGKLARDCFAAPPGFILMQADYSQLELRVAAELADDDVMRELFRSGVDFHLGTAKLISQLAWGIAAEHVTKVHRSGAKEFNFGLLYGKTDRTLAAQLGIPLEAAKAIRKAIFGAFIKLGVWHRRVTQEAKEEGGCWTMWEGERARWRPLLDLGNDSEDRRGYYITALNGAVNSPVQGTASDFCIASLARCVETIERGELDAELILPIHDSLMFLVPRRKVDEVALQVRSIMTDFPWCKTPLEVDVEVGERWGSLEKFKEAV